MGLEEVEELASELAHLFHEMDTEEVKARLAEVS